MIGFLNENDTPAWNKEFVNLPNQFAAFLMLQLQSFSTSCVLPQVAGQRLLSSSVVLLPVQHGLPAIFLTGFFLGRQSSSST